MPNDKQGRNSFHSGTNAGSAKPSPATEEYWRSFPLLESLLKVARPPLLDKIKATCQQLDNILKSGSPQEKARAQEALGAFNRTIELYQELVNRRDQIVSNDSNQTRGQHDK